MFKRLILPPLLWLSCLVPQVAAADVGIMTTIKPLQLIAAAVTEDVSTPSVLIPAEQSSHHFTLKPSDVRRLHESQLLLWIGPSLERYLIDLVGQLRRDGGDERVLTVAGVSGLTRHGLGDRALIEDEEEDGHGSANGAEQIDPHVWLDTGNAARIAAALADRLQTLDPANAERYADNLADFREQLSALEGRIREQLAPLSDRPFAVYHDAFQYFERQFGLRHRVAIVADEAVQPGMRQLLRVRRALQDRNLECLIEDTTADDATIRTALGDSDLPRVRADTMGAGLTADGSGYIQLLEQLTAAFRQCLRH